MSNPEIDHGKLIVKPDKVKPDLDNPIFCTPIPEEQYSFLQNDNFFNQTVFLQIMHSSKDGHPLIPDNLFSSPTQAINDRYNPDALITTLDGNIVPLPNGVALIIKFIASNSIDFHTKSKIKQHRWDEIKKIFSEEYRLNTSYKRIITDIYKYLQAYDKSENYNDEKSPLLSYIELHIRSAGHRNSTFDIFGNIPKYDPKFPEITYSTFRKASQSMRNREIRSMMIDDVY